MDKKLYVVGIGPGGYEEMTLRAAKVLQECEQIVGYSVYLDLIRQYFPGKAFYATPMREEVQRCQHALAMAGAGKRTARISSMALPSGCCKRPKTSARGASPSAEAQP